MALAMIVLLGGCAHGARVRYVACGTEPPEVRPTDILLACAGTPNYLTNIHWTRWAHTDAAGTGTQAYSLCASCRILRGPVTVRLFRVRTCGGTAQFTRLRYMLLAPADSPLRRAIGSRENTLPEGSASCP